MNNVKRYYPEGFTTISNDVFKDERLSYKARGLLGTMFSLPPEWKFSVSGLTSIAKDGKDSVMSAISELEECGYLVREACRNDRGQFLGYDYHLYQHPNTETPSAETPLAENPSTVKPTLLNNKELNTYELNTEDINTDVFKKESIKKKSRAFTKPTAEEVSEYCRQRGNTVNPDKFFAYYESNGWMVGRKKMVDWKAAVRTWELNEKERASTQNTGSRRGQTICPDLYFSNDKCRESLKNEVVPF